VAAAKAILARVKAGKLSAEFSARDIQRNDWAQRGKSETIKDALELLYDRGWILARKPITGTAGRPKTYYRLNPRAKQLL
jgi:DNA-binding PadR family transcriptional regulator